MTFNLVLRLVAGASAAFALTLASAAFAQAAEREVRLGSEPGPLVGTFETPEGSQKGAAILLLAGSGPTNRDGSQPQAGLQADTLELIAADLARHGYASLRADKRCIGGSKLACPGEANLTIQSYVDDAAAWTGFLRSQPRVRCVVILGHSEGALIAALAAAKVQTCGVVSIAGVGRPFSDVLVEQIRASGAGDAVTEKARSMLSDLRVGRDVGEVPSTLASLFRPSVQPYVRSELAVDPTAALAAVKAPVLILQGTTDIQVGVQDSHRLAAESPKAKLILLDGVNHVLKKAPVDRAANLATYRDPTLPLAPAVMPAILGFLDALRP